MAQFDYGPLRAIAINLVKTYGRPSPLVLMRNVNTTPDDAAKPWRGAAAITKEFQFQGTAFDSRDATADGDKDIIIPGDLATTAADGDPATLCGEVLMTDRIRLPDGGVYGILNVNEVRPGADVIIWKVKARAWQPILNPPVTPF
jgi:hypothetical protein